MHILTLSALLISVAANAETENWDPIISGSASSYENLVRTIYLVARCESEPLEIESFLSELNNSPLSSDEKIRYRKRIIAVQTTAKSDMKHDASNIGIPIEQYIKQKCFSYRRGELVYNYLGMSNTLRFDRDRLIKELREGKF